jgi:hypothetical protein
MVLFTIVSLFLLIGGVLLLRRLRRLLDEVAELRRAADEQSARIAGLTQRVYDLEGRPGLRRSQAPPPSLAAPAVEEPSPVAPLPLSTSSGQPAREDWETVVGTNWLNRVGALVLVIGIALFLGYSLTHLGPAGKVAIGFILGLSMLAAGVALEEKERYRNFAFSLIGGGWAATYFTGYAMHGIEAARVITSPVAGTGVLLAISAAMIFHALRYKSETAAALAYLFAFASLNVTPLTTFSVVATAVLAASLLFLANTFGWMRLAVAGAVLTYSTFVLRYDASIYGPAGVLNGQATLWIYWVLFESFDLLDLRRRGPHMGIERSLFLLNATGFAGSSLLHEWTMNSQHWAMFLGISSLAYLVSSFLRARLVPRVGEEADSDRIWQGGYEGSVAAASALMAAALIERFSGLRMTMALLMEGELVLLAGLALRNKLIQKIAGLVLCGAFIRLVAVNVWSTDEITVAGFTLYTWTPVALLMAGVFTVNRLLRGGGPWYSAAASILAAIVVSQEVNRYWVVVVWAAMAVAALWTGIRLDQRDLRFQAYIGTVATLSRACFTNIYPADTIQAHVAAAIAVVLLYAGQSLLARTSYTDEESRAGAFFSIAATSLLTAVLFDAVQGRLLTVVLGFEGAVLLGVGFVARERVLRLSGLIIFLLCIAKLFAYDLRELDTLSRIFSFIVLGVMLLAASWVYTRYREKIRRLL